MKPAIRIAVLPAFRRSVSVALMLSATALAGCASMTKPPAISYDASVPPLPAIPAAVIDERPKPVLIPPAWTVARGGETAGTPTGRVENANAAARVQPRREGYYNAIQIYPWSEGALYQVYAVPGQITDIALEPGESLTGAGPIAAGDTARWIIGDTESGSGVTRRVHILVKPSRPDITTNLIVTTDRRTYMIELRSGEKPYMPSVAWAYPQPRPASARAFRPRRSFRPWPPAIIATLRPTPAIRRGSRSPSMTMAVTSMSNSRVASSRARCRRSSSSARKAKPRSPTTASINTS